MEELNDLVDRLCQVDWGEDADAWLAAEEKTAIKITDAAKETIMASQNHCRGTATEAPALENVIGAVRDGQFSVAAERYATIVFQRGGLVPSIDSGPRRGEDALPGMVADPEVIRP